MQSPARQRCRSRMVACCLNIALHNRCGGSPAGDVPSAATQERPMSSRRQTVVHGLALAVAAGTLMPLAAIGQANNPAPSYRPGLGDLMTMTVQPRHLKVGLALEQRNWAYAAYELHE